MVSHIRRLWEDESGAVRMDWIILFGLFAVAGLLWYAQLGGGEGLSDALASAEHRGRQLSHILP